MAHDSNCMPHVIMQLLKFLHGESRWKKRNFFSFFFLKESLPLPTISSCSKEVILKHFIALYATF